MADNLPAGIEYDGEVYWATCPECDNQQGDAGTGVSCEECGFSPMPSRDYWFLED